MGDILIADVPRFEENLGDPALRKGLGSEVRCKPGGWARTFLVPSKLGCLGMNKKHSEKGTESMHLGLGMSSNRDDLSLSPAPPTLCFFNLNPPTCCVCCRLLFSGALDETKCITLSTSLLHPHCATLELYQ